LGWDNEPARHSLSRLGIDNRAFGIKGPDFVKPVDGDRFSSDVDRELNAQDLWNLLQQPSTVERQKDVIYIGTGWDEAYTRKMTEIRGDTLPSIEFEPDFLFDAEDYILYNETNLNTYLGQICGGDFQQLTNNDSFRASLMAFMLTMFESPDKGKQVDWAMSISLLRPYEKRILFQKYLKMIEDDLYHLERNKYREVLAFFADVPKEYQALYTSQLDFQFRDTDEYQEGEREKIKEIMKLAPRLDIGAVQHGRWSLFQVKPKEPLLRKKDADIYYQIQNIRDPEYSLPYMRTTENYMRRFSKKSKDELKIFLRELVTAQIQAAETKCKSEHGGDTKGIQEYDRKCGKFWGDIVEKPLLCNATDNLMEPAWRNKSGKSMDFYGGCSYYGGELERVSIPSIDDFTDTLFLQKWSDTNNEDDKKDMEYFYEYYVRTFRNRAKNRKKSKWRFYVNSQPDGYELPSDLESD